MHDDPQSLMIVAGIGDVEYSFEDGSSHLLKNGDGIDEGKVMMEAEEEEEEESDGDDNTLKWTEQLSGGVPFIFAIIVTYGGAYFLYGMTDIWLAQWVSTKEEYKNISKEERLDWYLGLTFSTAPASELISLGTTKEIELIPGGSNISVTNENKRRYDA